MPHDLLSKSSAGEGLPGTGAHGLQYPGILRSLHQHSLAPYARTGVHTGASVAHSHRHGVLRENDILFLMLDIPRLVMIL